MEEPQESEEAEATLPDVEVREKTSVSFPDARGKPSNEIHDPPPTSSASSEELRHRCPRPDEDRESWEPDGAPYSDFGALDCRESARQFATRVWEARWRGVPHHALPAWLQDNDFLLKGHRPPLESFVACFKSIFRIHTETVNIWTHLLGAILFVGVAVAYLLRHEENLENKIVLSLFFAAAIICLSLSWLYHTLSCHSFTMSHLFVKLDYCGIAILIMGSFVPWLYFGFYCSFFTKLIYLMALLFLGSTVIVVSSWDKFSLPHFRPLRAALFICLGLSGVVPAVHYSILEGFVQAFTAGCLNWLCLMALVYICGTLLYALRIPERFFPGKCDIWFQSHQLFHVCVVIGCFVHYHGICALSDYTMQHKGDCVVP